MLLIAIAYLGGVLTILSPCILPVLPFVFARADRPFIKSGLPLLAGMAITFAGVATLAAIGGGWAVQANEYGRLAAITLLAVSGIALLFPQIADRLTRPVVTFGARLSQSAAEGSNNGSSVWPSFLLGIATGFLWAPCAGPILGLILTGAALQGANVETTLLLLAYAAGAATSLALALLIGGKVFTAMKRGLGAGEWVRRALGIAVLCGVAAIALGLDTGILARLSVAGTTTLEQALIDGAGPDATRPASSMMLVGANAAELDLPVEGLAPSLSGAVDWLNTAPLSLEQLRGKVVLVDFWTYSCINCLRTLPYTRAWAEKYADQGLVVIGVHSPEFAFEKNIDNVTAAAKELGVDYPIAIDNDFAVWRAYGNQYWPALYFIDAKGQIRHHHFGEGQYEQSEQIIQQLLKEAGNPVKAGMAEVDAVGAQAAPDLADMASPETYLGYAQASGLVSDGVLPDAAKTYAMAPDLGLNQWSLAGNWTIGADAATSNAAGTSITNRFHARDLHLVLGSDGDNKPVRFRVSIDGKPPGKDHGSDIDEQGNGTITGVRLYQLVRQNAEVKDRTFAIEFLDPGAQAFAFTFG